GGMQASLPGISRGGFYVLRVERVNPTDTSRWITRLFNTAVSSSDQSAMLAFLRQNAAEDSLIFVVSSGAPFTSQNGTTRQIGQQIALLGGSSELFTSLGPVDTYAAVLTAQPPAGIRRYDAPEASTLISPNGGSMKGALAKGRRGAWYGPLGADLTGTGSV